MKLNLLYLIKFGVLIILIASSLNLSFAQETAKQTTPPPIVPGKNELQIPHTTQNNISEGQFLRNGLLPGITSTIIGITGGLALIFVIVGGLQMLTSFGDPEKFAKGKKIVTWALIGILIGILSYAIVAIITNIKV